MTDVLPPLGGNAPQQKPPALWKQHPVTQILIFAGLMSAVLLTVGLPLLAVFHFSHVRIDPFSESGGLTVWFCLALASVVGFSIYTGRTADMSLAEAGLTPHGIFSETGIGLMIGGGVFSAVIGMMGAFGVYQTGGFNPHFRPLIPLALFLCIAVFQETAMRGCIFQTLERRYGSWIALIASSLFFGLLHLGSPVEGLSTAEWLTGPIFLSFETSLLFTAAYLLTRRLWLPIGLHWGWNFFETSIYGNANSGAWENDPNTLFAGHVHGPFLLTGGSFGPEASLICLGIGFYAGIVLLRLAVRKGQWRTVNASLHQVK